MNEYDIYIIIGKKLKELREQQGLSQQDLSAITNMEVTAISRIENGRTNITIGTLYKICKALKCELSTVIDFSINSQL